MNFEHLRLPPLLCAFLLACASAPATERGDAPLPRGDARTITLGDITGAPQLNLLDFIVAERPTWVRAANGSAPNVTVYLGDARLGGLSTLAGIPLNSIRVVRYHDASAAQQKFNVATIGPVIQVIPKR